MTLPCSEKTSLSDQLTNCLYAEVLQKSCNCDSCFEIAISHVPSHDHLGVNVCTIKPQLEATHDVPASWGFTNQELQTAQRRDINLQIILDWLLENKAPDEGVLFLSSPEAKYFWINKEMFSLKYNVLYRSKEDSPDLELVIPQELKEQAIRWHHDTFFGPPRGSTH